MSATSEQTQFKVGNDAWKARSTHGRKPKFNNAETLEAACLQYFQWVEHNPLMTVELVKYQGDAKQVQVPRMRATTITGLCNFLDIDRSTWKGYCAKPDFSSICGWVEGIIYQQKFEGAAADMLNASIIARDIGLSDKEAIEDTAVPNVMLVPIMSPDDWAEAAAKSQHELKKSARD